MELTISETKAKELLKEVIIELAQESSRIAVTAL